MSCTFQLICIASLLAFSTFILVFMQNCRDCRFSNSEMTPMLPLNTRYDKINCCKIFIISTFCLRRFRFETRKTSAQLQCTSAPCCASKKPCVQRCDCANFSPENARIRCKFSARSTRNAPTIRPVSLRKHGDVSELLRRFAGACNAENARSQRSNMRKILLKFAMINGAGICCKIFTISTHSAANFAAFQRKFRF